MRGMYSRLKTVRNKIKNDPFELDEEGREIVDISILDSDEMLSVYNPDGKQRISDEMAQVIDNSIKTTSYNKDIHLRFTCAKVTPEKEALYQNAIVNYYINEFGEHETRLHNNSIISLVVFILSIVSFGLLFLLKSLDVFWLITEFIDVVAWVFAWETVDLLFFQRQLIKYEERKNLKVIYAKITFRTL